MTHQSDTEHPDEEMLSASIDDRLTPAEASAAREHLEGCEVCRQRVEELRSVVGLLRALPSVDPPRRLWRLRVVPDPPNVVRLRRLYAVSRAGAGSLAAAFVLVSAAGLYAGAQPQPTVATLSSTSSQAAPAFAPAPPAAQSAPAGAAAPAGADAARPASPQANVAARAAAPAAAQPAAPPAPPGAQVADQTSAVTSVRPPDPAAPWRTAALLLGVLAACGVLAAVAIRRRLPRTPTLSTTE